MDHHPLSFTPPHSRSSNLYHNKKNKRQPVQLKSFSRYATPSTPQEFVKGKKGTPKEMDIRPFGYLATPAFRKNSMNTSLVGSYGVRVVRSRPSYAPVLNRQRTSSMRNNLTPPRDRRKRSTRQQIVATLAKRENRPSGGRRRKLECGAWQNARGLSYR